MKLRSYIIGLSACAWRSAFTQQIRPLLKNYLQSEMDVDTSSYEVRPTMLLSSLVQTRSIELVLAPIASQVQHSPANRQLFACLVAAVCFIVLILRYQTFTRQVSQLIILTDTRETPFPNLMPSAQSVMDAVQNLADVAEKITKETADEVERAITT